MAMSVGTSAGATFCDINTTPLIDVMLVLLVTLIVTLPIMTHAVKLDMPNVTNPPPPPPHPPPASARSRDLDAYAGRAPHAMAMSVGTSAGSTFCDINTTPLIDVMLVLLVTLIVTLPIMTHAVKLDMPNVTNPPPPPPKPPEVIELEIDFDG